jgi:hypothetical protein
MDLETAYNDLIRGEGNCALIFDLLYLKSLLPGRTGNILDAEKLINEI